MRVLMVMCSMMGGGAERQMALLLERLPRDRFDISLCLIERFGEFLERVPPDVEIIDLNKRSPRDFGRLVVRLADVLRRRSPDLVIAKVDYANVITALAASLAGAKVPLILGEESVPTFAATYMSYPTLRLALLAWAYHRATYVTAPSPGVAAQVEQDLRVPRESLCVIPNMIETAAIAREAAQPPPEELARARARGEAVIVTAGRLHPAKGQEDLLRALPILAARSGRCRLFVLGIGRDRPRLERLSRELGVESEVEFLGFVRNPYAFFANADVFVSPSHAESFGNVIIEAMAAGAPIVSTDVPAGPRWIVEDGRTGTLARARDPADLAAKIAEVLDDPVRAEAMVRHGRSFVTRFDAAEVVPQYVAVCERALRGHALGVPSAVRS